MFALPAWIRPGTSRGAVRSALCAVLLLLVGFAVLAWGTAYKASLYTPQRADRAPAKLCTRASDACKAELEKAVMLLPVSLIASAGLLVLEPGAPPLLNLSPRREQACAHHPVPIRSAAVLFRRPPPVASAPII